MLQQFLAIARNTFTESIRQPIFAVLILAGGLLLILNLAWSANTLDDDNKLMIDAGFSMVAIACLFMAAFTATGVLSSEVENKTVLTVVSKPVSRPTFVLGKYAGVAAAIAMAFFVLSIIFVLTIRHRVMQTRSDPIDGPVVLFGLLAAVAALGVATWGNYLYNWVFASSFVITLSITQTVGLILVLLIGKGWQLQSPATDFLAHHGELIQVVIGLLLVFEAVLVLTAVAIAASTRLGQVMTLMTSIGVFLIGLISNSFSPYVNDKLMIQHGVSPMASIRAIFAADTGLHLKLVYFLAKLGYLVVPNLQFLWPTDAITQENPFSLTYVATVSAYSLLHVVVIICVAVGLFQTREVG